MRVQRHFAATCWLAIVLSASAWSNGGSSGLPPPGTAMNPSVVITIRPTTTDAGIDTVGTGVPSRVAVPQSYEFRVGDESIQHPGYNLTNKAGGSIASQASLKSTIRQSRIVSSIPSSGRTSTTLNSKRQRASVAPTDVASSVDCQAALVSWSSASSHIHKAGLTQITSTHISTTTHTIEWGDARVYTVLHGYTHAHGSLNVTSTSTFVASYPSIVTNTVIVTTKPVKKTVPPRPDCTINPETCSSLYDAYRSSLGLDSTDLLPQPFFDPTNSPRCTLTQGTSSCITRDVASIRASCDVVAHSVRLYYWRTTTGKHVSGLDTATSPTTTEAPKTIVTYGKTMTSPSVYLHFDTIRAISPGAYQIDCPSASLPESSIFWKTLGRRYTSQWFSFPPESVSTLEKYMDTEAVKLVPPATMSSLRHYARSYLPKSGTEDPFGPWPNSSFAPFPHAALTAMGNASASDYSIWASVIQSASLLVTSSQIDFHELIRPGPRAYYLRPAVSFSGTKVGTIEYLHAQGCHPQGPHPACNTILNNAYHAQLSIPQAVRELDPAWATCQPALLGVYDPPIGLDPTDSVDMPDVTTTAALITSSASPIAFPYAPLISATALSDQVTSIKTSQEVVAPTQAVDTHSTLPKIESVHIYSIKEITTTYIVSTATQGTDQSTHDSSRSAVGPTSAHETGQIPTEARVFPFSDPDVNTAGQQDPSNALQALTQSIRAVQDHDGLVSAAQPPTAAIIVGSITMTATRLGGHVVMDTATLQSGQAFTTNGLVISNAASAMVALPVEASYSTSSMDSAMPGRPEVVTTSAAYVHNQDAAYSTAPINRQSTATAAQGALNAGTVTGTTSSSSSLREPYTGGAPDLFCHEMLWVAIALMFSFV